MLDPGRRHELPLARDVSNDSGSRIMNRVTPILFTLVLAVLAGCNGSPTQPGDLAIRPGTVTVESGRAVQLTVTNGDGDAVTTGVEWMSSNRAAAIVNANGMVTGRYANGSALVTARVGAASVSAEVSTVPRVCFAIAELEGSPDPAEEIQTFDVLFEPGIDPARLAQELAARYGFEIDEITAGGFIAQLTPEQAGGVLCEREVERMTYL
jgi:hypothetical protein